MTIPLILGRDFLRLFNIRLRDAKKKYSRCELLEIRDRVNSIRYSPKVTGSDAHSIMTKLSEPYDNHENEAIADDCKEFSYSVADDVHDIFNIDFSHNENDVTINPELPKVQREDFKSIIDGAYFNTDAKTEPFKYEMKIHLTSDVPFHCAPRRLSYAERDQVRSIIEELRQGE